MKFGAACAAKTGCPLWPRAYEIVFSGMVPSIVRPIDPDGAGAPPAWKRGSPFGAVRSAEFPPGDVVTSSVWSASKTTPGNKPPVCPHISWFDRSHWNVSVVVGDENHLGAGRREDLEAALAERRRDRPLVSGDAHAQRILDALDSLKIELLEGTLNPAMLERLTHAVREQRSMTDDPKLEDLLDQVETRAAVELAKHEVSRVAT